MAARLETELSTLMFIPGKKKLDLAPLESLRLHQHNTKGTTERGGTQGTHRVGKGEGDAHFCTKTNQETPSEVGQEIKDVPRNTKNRALHVSALSKADAKETVQNLKP